MSSASSRMEEEKRRRKKKKPVEEGMATPPSDGRKKKKMKRKNSQRPHYEASNGEFAEEGGKGRKHEREAGVYQSAVEADGFKQKDKKNKEKKKRKQLELQQEQQEDVGEEKRKSQTQKRRRQQDQPDEGMKNKKKKRAREGDGKGGGEPDGRRRNLITDERFAAAHSDPRFQRLPQRESRVTIDDRFSGMFSNKAFFSSSAPVDKRGKPKKKKSQNPLLHYYLREEEATPIVEEEDIEDDNRASLLDEEPESSTLEEDDPDGPGADSDMSSSTEEDDEDESDQHAENNDAYQFWVANQEDATTIENETHRLAVVNMDWDHIKAVDLYVMMSTCLLTSCPQNGGQILSVAIYPSEFGLKCMEIEAIRGPHALFDDEKNVDDDDDDNESDDEIVNEKIRSYQLNRLKYYYAVVECDSSATANHLYNSLDGIEFLKTANVLDLRFIPDTMEFKHPPRDIAAEVPPDYKQPEFETIALQHSNVKLTWDDDEPDRKKTLRQKFNPKKMDELEQYLASDDSDDDDDENEVHGDKYNALLQSADASGADEDDDTGKEMEVTFLAGVENLSKHIDKNKLKKSEEGVWDAYLRRRREKIKAKKNRKFSSDEDTSDSEYNETPHQPDDFFVEEPSDYEDDKKGRKKGSLKAVNRSNKKNRRDSHEKDREEETREASRAELELLLADDDGTNEHLKGFNLRPKKAKGKKGKEAVPMEDKLPDVDAPNDPRFSSRLTSHLFALDPTDPQYKRSATGMRKVQVQKQQKDNTRALAATGKEGIELSPDDEKPPKEKQTIMSLVRSLKLKSMAKVN